MARISFLIPTYNRADYLAEAVHSITSQMSAEDEIIIVDDGSEDETASVLAGLGTQITHYRQDNSGKSIALNLAMTKAGGEYVWICDDDDILVPDAISTLLNLVENTGSDFVFGRYSKFTFRDGRRVDLGMAHWPPLHEGSPARHILEDAFVMHNATLARRSLYDRVGPFDPEMLRAQDYDMFVRCAVRGKAAFTDQTIFLQRKHEGARGPSSALHAAKNSNMIWQEYDRRIFERVHSDTPLSFFEGMFASRDAQLTTRAALLQRGTIMARHDLWDLAISDWKAASAIDTQPLVRIEKDICRRAMAGKHGFTGALDNDAINGLLKLKQNGSVGEAIVRELIEGLVWRLRDSDHANRPLARRLIAQLSGRMDLMRALINRTFPGSSHGSDDQAVTELSEIVLLP